MRSWIALKHFVQLSVVGVLLEGVRAVVLPPLEEQGVADQLEPRGEFEVWFCEHLFQFVCRDPGGIPHLVRADVQIDVGLDKEDVVDYTMLDVLFLSSHAQEMGRHLPSCSPHFPSLGAL